MTIDLEQLRNDIVADASEDHLGLYEIIWSLDTTYATATPAQKLSAARSIVEDLVATNVIELSEQ